MGFPTTHARRSRRPRLDRWPTRSAKMSLRRNVRLCRNKFASACQTRCASRCQSSSAILSTRSSRSGSADRRRRKSATYQANQKLHHLWHQVFLWLLVPTFRAPAPVPSSPSFNQQPTFEDSLPLDQQRGVSFEDEDDHASV